MSSSCPYDDAYYASNSQDGDRVALRWYARIAQRLVPEGSRVLDFGCGVGHFARHLSHKLDVVAYDASEAARERARRNAPGATVVDDLGEIPDESLDMVVSLHVLEHIDPPDETLATFRRLTRPGGRLLYVVPNPQGWGHRIKDEEWFAYRDPTHCALLDRDDWIARTWGAGYVVEKVAADGLWDPPYVGRVPRLLQLGTLGLPAAAQVALGRAVLPRDWGECIIVTARRRP